VGAFVLAGLIFIAVLLLIFSKGASLLAPTYEITMRLRNVGGLKERSAVLLAGIQIGHLRGIELGPGGTNVLLHLRLLKKYEIYSDAEFTVEQIGVLGDQFVAIYPRENQGRVLRNGDQVEGVQSFDLQQIARSAGSLIDQLGATLVEVRAGITNIKQGLLDPTTQSNLAVTAANFRRLSEQATGVLGQVAVVIATNERPLAQTLSNAVRLSARLESAANHLEEIILTNQGALRATMTNAADTAALLKQTASSLQDIAQGLEAGEGLAGGLLKDPALRWHAAVTVSNLAVLSSNLNRHGLLYRPRPPRANRSTNPAYSGKIF